MRNVLKISSIIILFWVSVMKSSAQTEHTSASNHNEIFSSIRNAQSSLKTISYTLKRIDTLVTDEVRGFTGMVMIQKDDEDTVFGFKFWSKLDGDNSEQVYNGHIGYLTNGSDKSYQLKSNKNALQSLLYSGSGRLIMPDFIKLDTLNANAISISQNKEYYHITITYPDILKYDVSNRRKILTIDKSSMLPIAVQNHQETLGKVQDTYYKIEEMKINDSKFHYDFTSPPFLKDYKHSILVKSEHLVFSLKDKIAPSFNLETFDGKTLASTDISGRLILLDFWEVWCGPCIESMPKVQQLYETYKNKGLNVYGITNDSKQLQTAKQLIKKQEIQFPMLIGNEKLRQDYKFSGTVPLYILIDKNGTIALVSEGYPSNLEEVIKRML